MESILNQNNIELGHLIVDFISLNKDEIFHFKQPIVVREFQYNLNDNLIELMSEDPDILKKLNINEELIPVIQTKLLTNFI